MPELPEVETTRRGIAPHVTGKRIRDVIIRRTDLRQAVSPGMDAITGQRVIRVRRRSKYLLIDLERGGTLLIHLGMSGSLRVTCEADDWRKHDHIGITLSPKVQLRYHDPRRFGLCLLISKGGESSHPLLAKLGPEPLDEEFTTDTLVIACRNRSTTIKQLIMDARVVVGVGNIYASEALFRAGIRPRLRASGISRPRLEKLTAAIREVLADAIAEGGTTLRDFVNSNGQPGYFSQRLFVYDRSGKPCRICQASIQRAIVGQRSAFWCPQCQR